MSRDDLEEHIQDIATGRKPPVDSAEMLEDDFCALCGEPLDDPVEWEITNSAGQHVNTELFCSERHREQFEEDLFDPDKEGEPI